MIIYWLIHTAMSSALHETGLRCSTLTLSPPFLKRLDEYLEVHQVEKQRPALLRGESCSLVLLHYWLPLICFLSYGFFTFPSQYFSSWILELLSPSQRVSILSAFLLFLSFMVLAHGFSVTLNNNFLSKTKPRSQSCAASN